MGQQLCKCVTPSHKDMNMFYKCSCKNYISSSTLSEIYRVGYSKCKCGKSVHKKDLPKANNKKKFSQDFQYKQRLENENNIRKRQKTGPGNRRQDLESEIRKLPDVFQKKCSITDSKETKTQDRKRKLNNVRENDFNQLPDKTRSKTQKQEPGSTQHRTIITVSSLQTDKNSYEKEPRQRELETTQTDKTTDLTLKKRPVDESCLISVNTSPYSRQSYHSNSTDSTYHIIHKSEISSASYKHRDYERRESVKGLPNVGMTCYVNSLLQILNQTPGFLSDIQRVSDKMFLDKTVTRLLCKVIEHMSYRSGASVLAYDELYRLVNKVCSRDSGFSIGSQNDCHYFMTTLFKMIKDEASSVKTDALHMFEGTLQNRFRYSSCAHTELSNLQLFTSIVVPIPKNVREWSVEEGLSKFFEAELFSENEIPCKRCGCTNNKIGCYTKFDTVFSRLPDVLILQLGRFQERHSGTSGVIVKNNVYVSYPASLNLDGIENSERYFLYGVVNHHGSLSGGHYTAYVRKMVTDNDREQIWFSCSDSHVGRIDEQSVYRNSSAYLLFYYSLKPRF